MSLRALYWLTVGDWERMLGNVNDWEQMLGKYVAATYLGLAYFLP